LEIRKLIYTLQNALHKHAFDLKQAEGLQFAGLKHLTLSGRERGNSLLEN